jgi:hypothetical protein
VDEMENIAIQLLEEENNKFYAAGRYYFKNIKGAVDAATAYVKEGLEVVVFNGEGRGDVLLAYGGPKMNEKTAMRYGTGTVERLTKKAQKVVVLK